MRELFDRKVKIVATLGPSTQSEEMLAKLFKAGVDVARLNFSHGDHEFHRQLFSKVRSSAEKVSRTVAVLQDLQGPKIRIGVLPEAGIDIKAGDRLILYPEGDQVFDPKKPHEIPIFREIALQLIKDVQVGSRILFDDGKIQSVTRKVEKNRIHVEVQYGGKLTSKKGMNLPGTPLSIPCVTDKDLKDLKLGLELGVDAVALSFVRSAKDIEAVRDLILKTSNESPLLFAKIEREEAIEDHEAIIEVSDGILVARGDMAVEVGVERVPIIQKRLIYASNEVGVPVITATQMLESMIQNSTPTRAEASDIANAVLDGTDAVMLSGETASGHYPIEAVQVMVKIIKSLESEVDDLQLRPGQLPLPGSVIDSIEYSASKIANHVDAKAIACISRSGVAARALAKYRPAKPLIAILSDPPVLRKMAFVWGVQGILAPEMMPTDDSFDRVEKILLEQGWVENQDYLVITAGIPTLERGTTNTIKVHQVGVTGAQSRSASKKSSG